MIDDYPGRSTSYGYSCQTWLAREINEFLHKGSYYCWFTKHFNAMKNGDSSNPIQLYLMLDRAVEQNDTNSSKIKDVEANLLYAIYEELTDMGRENEIPKAVTKIKKAPLRQFTPQIWKIKLANIADRYASNHQYPDEFKIINLKSHEFEVVID